MSFWLTDERLAGHWAAVLAPDWKERWPDYARFTPWLRIRGPRHPICWEDGEKRGENDVTSYAGVYVVARFDNAPAGPADPFDPAVDYIGRTRTAALGSRWRQFLNAAQGWGGHSGGNSFHAAYGHEAGVIDRTWIAGLPVWCGEGMDGRLQTSHRTAMIEGVLVDAVHRSRKARGLPDLLNKA